MAMIDHTCICFHNGMLMKETCHCDWEEKLISWETEDGKVHNTIDNIPINRINLLPFDINRDGLFTKDNAVKIEDMNRIFPDVWFNGNKRKEARVIKAWDKNSWKTEEKYPKLDFENRVYWYKDLNKLIITQHTKDYCLTFYFKLDTEDSWVVLGGYGHNCNPYTHFYYRGYGEEFEKKMALEAYQWICGELLPDLLDWCFAVVLAEDEMYLMGAENTEYYKSLAEILRFKHYWSMCHTDEDRNEYIHKEGMQYDPESIFEESE